MQEKNFSKNFKIKKLTITGVIPSFAFQRAKYCALELHRNLPQKFPHPDIVGLLELDWSEKLQEWRQSLGKEYWCLRRPVAVFFDDRFIGSDVDLIKLMTVENILMENIPRKTMPHMKRLFREDYLSYLKKAKRIYCYLDICINEVYAGTLTFQLYSDLLPRTCENFKTLCLGTRGPLLSYRGSRIHRIVKKGWLQGGDIQYKTGGGGFSVFCDPLEDESFGISHDKRGVLSMAGGSRHSNGSQFFITLQPSKWMDTHFVAFGQLIEGVKLLKRLENLETFYECPLDKVEIKSCGKLDLEDVEDVDARYGEEPMPMKKPKKIETISQQLVRLIIEALTEALERKERTPDILDDGDIPSKMNLQLYFQGFYSLPESILERTAEYLRNLRRKLFRVAKPIATEIVEAIMYDLLVAVLTRMTTLDDMRETLGHSMYDKMISGIDMEFELCQKSYVKRLVDQIVATAEGMVNKIAMKIQQMKRSSTSWRSFQERMQEWVLSFVRQETFKDSNYFIADRPVVFEKPKEEEVQHPKREGKPCCEIERKKKEEELKAKLRAKFGPADLCCLGSQLKLNEGPINLYDFFSTCRYDLKRVPKFEEERMPLLDLIEMSRFKLRLLRKQEDLVKSEGRLCTEKKIRKWMAEVVYTPETSWLKDAVFPKDSVALDHMEEILYGAMTAGLLEMYYFVEEYLKHCGTKRQKLVTTIIYPEDSETDLVKASQAEKGMGQPSMERKEEEEEKEKEEEEAEEKKESEEPPVVKEKPPCPCGHPCCRCLFDPNYKSPQEAKYGGEYGGEYGDEHEGEFEGEYEGEIETKEPEMEEPKQQICASDETLVDVNALMAKAASLTTEEIDIRSFRWLKPYIIEKGCDLKTEFASRVHKWFDGERFSWTGFISKHSLATRASLLSLSLSLAEIVKEENNLKEDIKNFIYDLWSLYFDEMFKETLLEFPPESESEPKEEEERGEEGKEGEGEGEGKGEQHTDEDECKKLTETLQNFDLDDFCKQFDAGESKEEADDENVEVKPEPAPEPAPEPESKPPPPPSSKTEIKPSEGKDKESAGSEESVIPPADGDEKDTSPLEPEEPVKRKKSPLEPEEPVKKKKSPIVTEELVDVPSSDESRKMPPYVMPCWMKFLTELTKQALGAMAKVSRLPRRLYFTTDSEMAFDDKMKEWFEFNAFNPTPTKGREIMEFIALNHKSLTNLEDTARSFLKKKKYTELMNRCTRFTSADDVAEEIIADVIDTTLDKADEDGTVELLISNLVSSAVTSTPTRGSASTEDEEEEADERSFDSTIQTQD